MPLNTIKPDLVKFEMRMAQGVDPHEREQRKPGAFGRFLSGLGRVLGSVALPLSFIFPPAAIGAAGMYGLGAIGDGVQAKAYQGAAEKAKREANMNVSFPGLQIGQGVQPAAWDLSARDREVMQVLDYRAGSIQQMNQQIGQ